MMSLRVIYKCIRKLRSLTHCQNFISALRCYENIYEMSETKQRIKSVAIDLFYKKGYFASSVSEIAKGSGIQKAGIYYHYSSKEELLYDIMKATMDDLMIRLSKIIEDTGDVESRIRSAVHKHVEFHLKRQRETFIANSELRGLSPEHYQGIVRQRDKYEYIFQSLIRCGMDKGIFPKGDVKILSYAILTLCNAGAFWFNASGRLSVNEIAYIYEDFVLNGLKHRKLMRET
ncbi:TetR/AcrR family transcriptional regulator [Desulfococcaceae bacterium HSG8]|nr:TetR/AcrR family transcriptional regulator [Desulfococcaceae bacterium HSG8]